MTQTLTTELLSVARAMRDYIDALPSYVVASLPTMPGFDRDWADEVIEAANREAQPVADGENCWSCGKFFTYSQHSECDGYCPHCNAPVDLDEGELSDED